MHDHFLDCLVGLPWGRDFVEFLRTDFGSDLDPEDGVLGKDRSKEYFPDVLVEMQIFISALINI